MRVVIAEDRVEYRKSLEAVLALEPGFEVVAAYPDGKRLIEAARTSSERPWDLALLDIAMPGLTGIEATRALKALFPEISVVILTVFEEPHTILEAICAGADGYLLKKTTAGELVEQLHVIANGGSPMTSEVARKVIVLLRGGGDTPKAMPPLALGLSDRELQVLKALADGLSYKRIADLSNLSVHTVRTYLRRIYRKLQVTTSTEAVSRATKAGLI
ncbi:MAG TPA: response regulator transcription factor [Candidatus Polarisedimenticolaceae bacterium]|nr:response regulator transcription factor [Candidatus Polarisedimenticolaceae bacterium]